MINDYFDTSGGVDTAGYVRALYAPHPILSGWVTKAQLRNAILLLTVVDGLVMLFLAVAVSPLIIAFALGGLFVSVFYVAPPLRLKHHGLGEPGVFIVWGPLMIGGTFLAATGTIPALGPGLLPALRPAGDLGPVRQAHRQDRARCRPRHPDPAGHPGRGARPRRRTMADDPLLPSRAAGGRWPAWSDRGSSLIVLGDPAADGRAQGLRPAQAAAPPPGYPERGWPLWFVGYAFIHTRRAGGLLTLGLLLNAVLPVTLPWLA